MTVDFSTFSTKPLKYLFVEFNSYFASVEQQLNPYLRGKPVAVVPMMTVSTCAIAASYEAKAYGIKTGTMIYEAKKICPDLICVQANHRNYVEFHEKILEETDKYLPIEKVMSIDEYVCELQGKECKTENAIEIAESIKKGIEENIGECMKTSIGIAQNRFLAKTATEIPREVNLRPYVQQVEGNALQEVRH